MNILGDKAAVQQLMSVLLDNAVKYSDANGVGLAIAKAVAEAHGGRITASCPSGKTMTIRVVL